MLIIKKSLFWFLFLRWGVISRDSLPDENSCLASLKQEHSVVLLYLTTGIRLLLREVSKPALKCGGEQQVHHLLPQMQAPHRLVLFLFTSKQSDSRPFSVALNTGKKIYSKKSNSWCWLPEPTIWLCWQARTALKPGYWCPWFDKTNTSLLIPNLHYWDYWWGIWTPVDMGNGCVYPDAWTLGEK